MAERRDRARRPITTIPERLGTDWALAGPQEGGYHPRRRGSGRRFGARLASCTGSPVWAVWAGAGACWRSCWRSCSFGRRLAFEVRDLLRWAESRDDETARSCAQALRIESLRARSRPTSPTAELRASPAERPHVGRSRRPGGGGVAPPRRLGTQTPRGGPVSDRTSRVVPVFGSFSLAGPPLGAAQCPA